MKEVVQIFAGVCWAAYGVAYWLDGAPWGMIGFAVGCLYIITADPRSSD